MSIDDSWIPDLGVRYSLGVDGISVFLVLMTAVLWFAATLWSALRNEPGDRRSRLYYFLLGLAETAALGAFIAQDLLLFVLFFDLMLIPFFFLIGTFGSGERIAATTKMIVYTLVGSLLMLVAAIATAILASGAVGELTFSIPVLREHLLSTGSQYWIFCFFAAAFLVKMPAFPDPRLDARRLPRRAAAGADPPLGRALQGRRLRLPARRAAALPRRDRSLPGGHPGDRASVSILYGSVMAFTQLNVRLIAGYSSIAQLGFITLGIFSLRPDGADGAVLQMVNHAIVVGAIFIVVAVLAERAKTEDLSRMGGMAMRAPVLAALFLVVALANLAMPGSANFAGEFYILNGVFQSKIVYAFVAGIGIALAAFYSLRLYQRAMHNRLPEGVESREISASATGSCSRPLVGRDRGAGAVAGPDPRARRGLGQSGRRRLQRRPGAGGTEVNFTAPHIDYAGLSPIIALTAGLVLHAARGADRRLDRAAAPRCLDRRNRRRCGTAIGLEIWQWGEPKDLVAGALRLDDLSLAAGMLCAGAAIFVIPLSWREQAFDRPLGPAGHGEFQTLLICSVLGMTMIAQAQNLIALFVALELLSVPLYVLCGSALRRKESLESGLKYLIVGSLGSATFLYGLAFIYGASGSTDFSTIADAAGGLRARRPAASDRDRARRHRPRVQALRRPLPPVDAGRLPGRAHPGDRVHGGRDQGRRLLRGGALLRRRPRPGGRRLAAGAGGAGRGLDRRRQRRRARPGLAQAPARLLGRRPGRLHARRRRRRHQRRAPARWCSTSPPTR